MPLPKQLPDQLSDHLPEASKYLEPAEEQIDLSGVRILIVDDEPDARSFLRFVLQQAGATIAEAGSALEALREIETNLPDVLLSDIGMPDMDGYALMRQVRMLPDDAQRNVPSIALTAFTRSEDRRRALLAGYQSHLSKPVETADLLVEIASLCGKLW